MPSHLYPVGSHLLVERTTFDHHAIVVGGGQVVEYAGGVIRLAGYAPFAGSGTVRRVATESPLDADTVLHRAMFLVGERKYSLLMNNCEHFASWCTTGDAYSSQVLWPTTWIGRAAAVLAAPVLIPINVRLTLGNEPWDAPQWCRHCEQEHGWDASCRPVAVRPALNSLAASRRELASITSMAIPTSPATAREVGLRFRATLPQLWELMDRLDSASSKRLANEYVEALQRVERQVVELMYEPQPGDAKAFQREWHSFTKQAEGLITKLRDLSP